MKRQVVVAMHIIINFSSIYEEDDSLNKRV